MCLTLWTDSKAEEACIGLFVMLLVIIFRYVHLWLIKRRIDTL